MSDTKFTPAPWVVTDGYYPSFVDVKCGEAMDIPICWYATDLSFENGVERKANAHLIAAAPEMYAALELLTKELPAWSDYEERLFIMADELLAKARGEL